MSYFRPPKARKTGPWSITRLSNSTQKMLKKGVGSKLQVCPSKTVSLQGCTPVNCAQFCAHHQPRWSATVC